MAAVREAGIDRRREAPGRTTQAGPATRAAHKSGEAAESTRSEREGPTGAGARQGLRLPAAPSPDKACHPVTAPSPGAPPGRGGEPSGKRKVGQAILRRPPRIVHAV